MICSGSSLIDGYVRRLTTHRLGFSQSFIQCLRKRALVMCLTDCCSTVKTRGINPIWQFCSTRSYQTFSQYINGSKSWTIVCKCIFGSDLKSMSVNLWSLQRQFVPENLAPFLDDWHNPQTYCGDLGGIEASYWAPSRSALTVVSPPPLWKSVLSKSS